MKKVLTISMLLLSTTAYAGGYQQPIVINKTYKTFNNYINNVTNETTNVTNITEIKRGAELGAGVDVVLWEAEADIRDSVLFQSVTGEYRYDWNNVEHKAYVVGRVNLWEKIKVLFGRD